MYNSGYLYSELWWDLDDVWWWCIQDIFIYFWFALFYRIAMTHHQSGKHCKYDKCQNKTNSCDQKKESEKKCTIPDLISTKKKSLWEKKLFSVLFTLRFYLTKTLQNRKRTLMDKKFERLVKNVHICRRWVNVNART